MNLLEMLNSQSSILLDGAMGTELNKLGLMGSGRNNLESPEAVAGILDEMKGESASTE